MPKVQYSRELLIKYFRPKPIEALPNAKFINSLLKLQGGQLIKTSTQFPVNYYKDELVIKGFNQEILVYSSTNTPNPLRTVDVQVQDQFRFDEQNYTPQPQTADQFFAFPPPTPSPAIQKSVAKQHNPIFSYSRQMRCGDIQQRQWFYIDDSNNVQGPFSTLEMDTWYTRGYFDDRTEIAFQNKNAQCFIKLKYIKQNKYIKGESKAYRTIIGRRKSAPQRLTDKEQSIAFFEYQDKQNGPQTTIVYKDKSVFEFPDSEDLTKQQHEQQHYIQQQQDNHENNQSIKKMLAIPSYKLGRKKENNKE